MLSLSSTIGLCLLAAALPASSSAQGATCGGWQVASPPVPATGLYGSSNLRDVVALAPDDVWAVGSTYLGSPSWETHTLAMHWDGNAWTTLPTPNPSETGINVLNAVAAAGPDDLWAVGLAERKDCLFCFKYLAPLVLRWDGVQWSEVDSLPKMENGSLSSVEVIGPDDVWFGGEWGGALTLHYDGSGFEVVPVPGFDVPCSGTYGCGHGIEDLSASGAGDLWAVGGAADGDYSVVSQIWHHDGSGWMHLPGPAPGYDHRLFGVAALAPDDVYAVGDVTAFDASGDGPFILHFDGTSWSPMDVPTFAYPSATLWDVFAAGPDDIWAVGQYTETEPPAVGLPLTLHYDGSSWTQVPAPVGPGTAWLWGVDGSGPCDAWAVGLSGGEVYAQSLAAPGTVCQTDLGFGGPGDVRLELCGSALASGGSADLLIDAAPALAPAWVVLGHSLNPTPLLGGTLVPVLPTAVLTLSTDAGGQLFIPNVPGGGGPYSLYLQAVVLDAAQPQGFAISNALQADFLP